MQIVCTGVGCVPEENFQYTMKSANLFFSVGSVESALFDVVGEYRNSTSVQGKRPADEYQHAVHASYTSFLRLPVRIPLPTPAAGVSWCCRSCNRPFFSTFCALYVL